MLCSIGLCWVSVFDPGFVSFRGLTVRYLLLGYLVVCIFESLFLVYLFFVSQFVCTKR